MQNNTQKTIHKQSKSALVILSIILTAIFTTTSVQAQSTSQEMIQDSKLWFGTSASLHYIIPSIDIHIGVEDALANNIDLRTTLSGFGMDGGGFLAVGVNGIFDLSNENAPIHSYMGFGPRALVFLGDGPGNNLALAVGGMWGAEFFTQNSTRPFVELNASMPLSIGGEFIPAFVPVFSLTTGFNIHF